METKYTHTHTHSRFYISDRRLWQNSSVYIVIVAVAFNPVASGCWMGFQETESSTLIVWFDPFLKSHPVLLFAHDSHLSCRQNWDGMGAKPLLIRQWWSHRKYVWTVHEDDQLDESKGKNYMPRIKTGQLNMSWIFQHNLRRTCRLGDLFVMVLHRGLVLDEFITEWLMSCESKSILLPKWEQSEEVV